MNHSDGTVTYYYGVVVGFMIGVVMGVICVIGVIVWVFTVGL